MVTLLHFGAGVIGNRNKVGISEMSLKGELNRDAGFIVQSRMKGAKDGKATHIVFKPPALAL